MILVKIDTIITLRNKKFKNRSIRRAEDTKKPGVDFSLQGFFGSNQIIWRRF